MVRKNKIKRKVKTEFSVYKDVRAREKKLRNKKNKERKKVKSKSVVYQRKQKQKQKTKKRSQKQSQSIVVHIHPKKTKTRARYRNYSHPIAQPLLLAPSKYSVYKDIRMKELAKTLKETLKPKKLKYHMGTRIDIQPKPIRTIERKISISIEPKPIRTIERKRGISIQPVIDRRKLTSIIGDSISIQPINERRNFSRSSIQNVNIQEEKFFKSNEEDRQLITLSREEIGNNTISGKRITKRQIKRRAVLKNINISQITTRWSRQEYEQFNNSF